MSQKRVTQGILRSVGQQVARRLELDGVYLTAEQARALVNLIGRNLSMPGFGSSAAERAAAERLFERVRELNRWTA